ncbi:hypothetical protein ABZV60_36320 [Streptomyces sp. NPDC004787]|uniref:hypothetical protein n=1 Tax=Streptomyces sp. NPDC004787 TaxID=3154291 RepID=UPI0033B09D7E
MINDEARIRTLTQTVRKADEVRRAVDISRRSSGLLLALLVAHSQQVVDVRGGTVNRPPGAGGTVNRPPGACRARGWDQHTRRLVRRRSGRLHLMDFALLDIPPGTVSALRLLAHHGQISSPTPCG